MDKNKYIKREVMGRREAFTGRQKEIEWEMCNQIDKGTSTLKNR